MEAVNGGSLGEDKGGPPPPSPLTGCYLLVVIGEPHSGEHKDIVLQRVAKGLLSWDVNNCLVDLEKELSIITDQGLEGEEARHGERLIQFASENLVTEILIHPAVSTLSQCVRNLLSSFTRHRHIIHAGYTFQGNGSWALQDGTFSYSDFSEAFQEIEVQRVIHAYENSISIDLHCSPEGEWARLPKESFTKACKVRVNPTDVLTTGSPSISNFIKYLAPFLVPTALESILESSDVVGNIRFSRPTLYVFPGGQGDAALFGINGFNMLLDGGYSRKACFWDFVRHLDRLDAVLLTRLNNSSVCGISSVLKRKRQGAVYPQVGHFFCNIQERKSLLSPDGDKDRDPLIFSILEEGQSIVQDLQYLHLTPQSCYRDSEPIILYHKVGHGTLNMYVLSPDRNSREVREFLQKWNQSEAKMFSGTRGGRDFSFPLQNLVSICALLVWQPANPNDTITRILYPGSTPQKKIFDGLDRLKSLECIKHSICSEKSLAPVKKTKQDVIEKLTSKDKAISEKRTENKLIEDALKNGEMNGDIIKEKQVKKSDSLESDKEKKTKKVEDVRKVDGKEKTEKIEDVEKIVENGEKVKVKAKSGDAQPIKKRGDSQHRKKPATEKKGPPTPKKTLENKTNGDVKEKEKEKKAHSKPSPTATPAKSTKDANNRRVIESKKTPPKKEAAPKHVPLAEAKPKPERKPISRRPKTAKGPPSPMKKMTNGLQKPDSISKRGKLDKEGTTDSSTVSTPSADQESILKKDISKLTPEEIQQLKEKELDELKEEQEAVKEIEAVFRKGEEHVEEAEPGVRKIKDMSIDDNLEAEEYLIIEKEEIEHDSLDQETKEDEMQKLARDSEESEKQRKLSSEEKEIEIQAEQTKDLPKEETHAKEEVSAKIDTESKKREVSSPEDKAAPTTDKKELADEEIKEIVESHPEEKVSANVESGATTTAPTLPEDERITLDEIKEDNGQPIEEKHVKEETKEKEVPIIRLPPQSQQDSQSKLPPNVGISLDKQKHIRDIVKTPDEVADLPVHEEADYHEFHGDAKKSNEADLGKELAKGEKKVEVKKDDKEVVDETKDQKPDVEKKEEVSEKEKSEEEKVQKNGMEKEEILQKQEPEKVKIEEIVTDEKKDETEQVEEVKESDRIEEQAPKKDITEELFITKDIGKDIKTESQIFLDQEKSATDYSIASAIVEKPKVPEECIPKTDDTQKFEILEKAELETKEKVEKESDKVLLEKKLKEDIDDEWVVITKEDEEDHDIVETAQEAGKTTDEKNDDLNEAPKEGTSEYEVVKAKDIKEDLKDEFMAEVKSNNEKLENLQKEEEPDRSKKNEQNIFAEERMTVKEEVKNELIEPPQSPTDKEPTKETKIESESEYDDHEIRKEDEIEEILEKEKVDIKALIEEADKKNLNDKKVDDVIEKPEILEEKINHIKETKEEVKEIDDKIQELKKEVKESVEELNLARNKRDLTKIEEPIHIDLKQDVKELAKIDDKLQELKQSVDELPMEKKEVEIETSTKSPEHAEQVTLPDSSPEEGDRPSFGELDIDKSELGRKSPAEREEDVKKIVASVAEVLKSEAPLEEFQGKLPFTQELRETHITTQDSPILDSKVITDDIPPIPEEPAVLKEEFEDVKDKRKDLIAGAQELMAASSKVISDIKSKTEEKVDKTVEKDDKVVEKDIKAEEKVKKAEEKDDQGKCIKSEEKNGEPKENDVIEEEEIAKAAERDDKVKQKYFKAEKTDTATKEKEEEDAVIAKEDKLEEKIEKVEDKLEETEIKDDKVDEKDDDSGTVHRMLVTASSEDGGEEIEICPPGTITFSKSSESSGRSSPEASQKTHSQKSSIVETLSDTLSTIKQITEKDLDIEKKELENEQEENKALSYKQTVEQHGVLDALNDTFDSAKELVKEEIEDLTKDTADEKAEPKLNEAGGLISGAVKSSEALADYLKYEVKGTEKKTEEDINEVKQDITDKIKEINTEAKAVTTDAKVLESIINDNVSKIIEGADDKASEVSETICDKVQEVSEISKNVSKNIEEDVKKGVQEVTEDTDEHKIAIRGKSMMGEMKKTTQKIEEFSDQSVRKVEVLEEVSDAQKIVTSQDDDAVSKSIGISKILQDQVTQIKDDTVDKIKVEDKSKELLSMATDIKDNQLEKTIDLVEENEISASIVDAKKNIESKIEDASKVAEKVKDFKEAVSAIEKIEDSVAQTKDQAEHKVKDVREVAVAISEELATALEVEEYTDKTESQISDKLSGVIDKITEHGSKDIKEVLDNADKIVLDIKDALDTKAEDGHSELHMIGNEIKEGVKKIEEMAEQKFQEVKDIGTVVTESSKTADGIKDEVKYTDQQLEEKVQDVTDQVLSKAEDLIAKTDEIREVTKETVEAKVREAEGKVSDIKSTTDKHMQQVPDKTEEKICSVTEEIKKDVKTGEELIDEIKIDVGDKITDISVYVSKDADQIQGKINLKVEHIEDKAKESVGKVVDISEKILDRSGDKHVRGESEQKTDVKASEAPIDPITETADETAAVEGKTESVMDCMVEKAEQILKKPEETAGPVFCEIGDAAKSVLHEILPNHKVSDYEIKMDKDEKLVSTVKPTVPGKSTPDDLSKDDHLEALPAICGKSTPNLPKDDISSSVVDATGKIQDLAKNQVAHIDERSEELVNKDLERKEKIVVDKAKDGPVEQESAILKNVYDLTSTKHEVDSVDVAKESLKCAEQKVKERESATVEEVQHLTATAHDAKDTIDIAQENAQEIIKKKGESVESPTTDSKITKEEETEEETKEYTLRKKESIAETAEDLLDKTEKAIESVSRIIGDSAKSVFDEILQDHESSSAEIKTSITESKDIFKNDKESEKLNSKVLSGTSIADVLGKDDQLEGSPTVSAKSIPDIPKDTIDKEIEKVEGDGDKSGIAPDVLKVATPSVSEKSSVERTYDTKEDTSKIEEDKIADESLSNQAHRRSSVIEVSEEFIEKFEKSIESVISPIGEAANSILQDKDHVEKEKGQVTKEKELETRQTDGDKLNLKKEDLQKEEKEIEDKTIHATEKADTVADLTKMIPFEKPKTSDEDKIENKIIEEKLGDEVEHIPQNVEELSGSNKKPSTLNNIKVDETGIKEDEKQIEAQAEGIKKNYEHLSKLTESVSFDKCKLSEDFKIDKDVIEKEEKQIDEKVAQIDKTVKDLSKLAESVSFDKCKPSDEFKIEKEVIEKERKHIEEKVSHLQRSLEEVSDLSQTISFEKCHIPKEDDKVTQKQVDVLQNSRSDMTKSVVSEKEEKTSETIKTEQSTSSSEKVIDSNKLEGIHHDKDYKCEKQQSLHDQQEKKDPEKEHAKVVEKGGSKMEEIKQVKSDIRESTKTEHTSPKKEEKKVEKEFEYLEESSEYKFKHAEKKDLSPESHNLEDKISEISKSKESEDIHKKEDPSSIAKASVVLEDNISSQTEKCEKESMEKTSSEKDSCSLNVEHTEHKKLSISDVEICIKTEKCPIDVSQSFLDNEKALLRDNTDAKVYVHPVSSQEDENAFISQAGSSSILQISAEAPALSDKSSPDMELSGKTTPPTVPVSPIAKEIKSPSSKVDSGLSEQTETDDEDLSTKSQVAHSQSDLDELDMKMDPMSMSFYGALPEEQLGRAEDVPATLLYEITKAKYTTELKETDKDSKSTKEVDLMTASFIGELPSAPSDSKSGDIEEEASKKDAVDSWGKPLGLPAPTYLYDVTKAKYSSSNEELDLMSCSFIGEQLPTSSGTQENPKSSTADPMITSVYFEHSSEGGFDPIASWGKPLGLPSPAPPNNNEKGTPKKERKLPAYVTAKNKLNDDKKRAESPSKLRLKKINPVYVDLTYVPHHGNHYYSYVDFFKKIRARYYVFSGLEPSRQVYDALLEAKQTWEDKELEVTIIPTYDTDILGYWVAENEELLSKFKIDLSPSASRCTINLQDHETSCSAYRLEF